MNGDDHPVIGELRDALGWVNWTQNPPPLNCMDGEDSIKVSTGICLELCNSQADGHDLSGIAHPGFRLKRDSLCRWPLVWNRKLILGIRMIHESELEFHPAQRKKS
jgi:hypothetical protein